MAASRLPYLWRAAQRARLILVRLLPFVRQYTFSCLTRVLHAFFILSASFTTALFPAYYCVPQSRKGRRCRSRESNKCKRMFCLEPLIMLTALLMRIKTPQSFSGASLLICCFKLRLPCSSRERSVQRWTSRAAQANFINVLNSP